MAPPLPLSASRESLFREYFGLQEKALKQGIGELTFVQVTRLEELHQRKLAGEFEKGISDAEISQRTQTREIEVSSRLASGKPPFGGTFFRRWRWDQSEQAYRFQSLPEANPSGIGDGRWQPEICQPGLGEGQPGNLV